MKLSGLPPGQNDQAQIRTLMSNAWAAKEAGRPQEAEAILQQIIGLAPRFLPARMALGILAGTTGQTAAAIERMHDVLKLDPRNVGAFNWLAMLYQQTGDIQEATGFAERAVSIEPHNLDALNSLARCYLVQERFKDALFYFDHAIEVNASVAHLHYGRGTVLSKLSRDSEAMDAFARGVDLRPAIEGLLKLADIRLSLGMTEGALAAARQALDMNEASPDAHVLVARTLMETDQDEEADVHWRRAEEFEPQAGQIATQRANSLNSLGRFEEAIAELRRSLESEPTRGLTYYTIAAAKRIDESDRPFVERMESVLSADEVGEDDQLNLHYALGKAYDNLGEYEKAISQYDLANENKKRRYMPKQEFDRKRFEAVIDGKIEIFSKELFSTSRDMGNPSEAPIAIVGMMRSGTTLAEQILSCHPKIGGAGEQSFWVNEDFNVTDYRRKSVNLPEIERLAAEYVEFLAAIAPGYPKVVDKNPANLLVAGQIHLGLPNARIIHTVRNPVDTALSIWMTPMRTTAEFVCDRESIVFAYKQYLRLMAHWREVLPADRFLEVDYESMVSEPEETTRKILDFCGLEWNEACLHPELNARVVKTPSFWQVRQPLYKTSAGRWKQYEPWLGVFRDLIPVGEAS